MSVAEQEYVLGPQIATAELVKTITRRRTTAESDILDEPGQAGLRVSNGVLVTLDAHLIFEVWPTDLTVDGTAQYQIDPSLSSGPYYVDRRRGDLAGFGAQHGEGPQDTDQSEISMSNVRDRYRRGRLWSGYAAQDLT